MGRCVPALMAVVCWCFVSLVIPTWAATSVPPTDNTMAITNMSALIEELKGLSLDELRAKEEQITRQLPEIGQQTEALHQELRDARQQARSDARIVEMYEQIEALKQQIETEIDKLPEVQAKAGELEANKRALLNMMRVRTQVSGMIALAEERLKQAEGDADGEKDSH